MPRTILVAYHGHCFDGMASAAVLARFLRAREGGPSAVEISFKGLDHQPGGSFVPPEALTADVNCVVDFRYSPSPRLGWWFDHHVSGIVGEEERAAFAADQSGTKFFDPTYGSCCQLIADVCRTRFGWEAPELADLVHWADVIDAARFPTAKFAVDLAAPALELMTVIEAHGDDRFLAPRIQQLAAGATLESLAAAPDVRGLLVKLRAQHAETLSAIRESARCERGVVTFDLSARGRIDRYNKFIPYWLFPESRYCVAVTASKARTKVSVGSNPWAPIPRSHDIAAICAGYGGGGHPVVGAITLPPGQVERAREIQREIAVTLGDDHP